MEVSTTSAPEIWNCAYIYEQGRSEGASIRDIKKHNGTRSSGLPRDCDSTGITAEKFYVGLDPLQRKKLVQDTCIHHSASVDFIACQKTKGAKL